MKANNKHLALSLALFFASASISSTPLPKQVQENNLISIEFSETYELANIILALTPYGQNESWEVQRGTQYYNEMMAYFAPYANHPLLQKVNYSQDQWKEYLSFRTDAYAFVFDKNNALKRISSFYTNKGISPFDDQLDLINDFIVQSGFRAFYEGQQAYYDGLGERYKKAYMLDEMRQFLATEFGGNAEGKFYHVILSPLTYRTACHRRINKNTEADFPFMEQYLVENQDPNNRSDKEKAIQIHSLFRELFTRYAASTSQKYETVIRRRFKHEYWNNVKGNYGNYDTNYTTFNEYLAWAVYDIFIAKHFPKVANAVSLDWHFQNKNRGFTYSHFFSHQLIELYAATTGPVRDLYPALLQWCGNKGPELSQARIVDAKAPIVVRKERSPYINISFTESLMPEESLTFTLYKITNRKVQKVKAITITKEENQLEWSEDGKKLSFILDLPDMNRFILDINASWDGATALKTKEGILLEPAKVQVIVK